MWGFGFDCVVEIFWGCFVWFFGWFVWGCFVVMFLWGFLCFVWTVVVVLCLCWVSGGVEMFGWVGVFVLVFWLC